MRILPFTAALLACVAGGIGADPKDSEAVDALLRKHFSGDGPGAAVAVLRGGEPVCERAIGLADLDAGTPIGPDTVFDLASCSKQFTGLAVALLVERGALSLEDDARKHLPELPKGDPGRPIRVADLVYMTCGLDPDYDAEIEDWTGITNETVLAQVSRRKPIGPPGVAYEYSNTAYNLLATLVARVSGRGFDDFLQEHVFRPCGMTDTLALDDPTRIVQRAARGYRNEEGTPVTDSEPNWVVGDGNVFSSVRDLARYDQALRAGKIVTPATLARLCASGRLDSGEPVEYAFGWGTGKDRHGAYVEHGGSWPGTSTHLIRYLAPDGLTVIVLANDTEADAEAVARGLVRIFAGRRNR